MNIFKNISDMVTAREAAELYGLKIGRNGMVCCPFHEDHTPSLKIDKRYYCFGCGAKGDAIDYTARLFGLSQIDAAKKLAEDLHLPISDDSRKTKKYSPTKKGSVSGRRPIKERFRDWCNHAVDILKEYEDELLSLSKHLPDTDGGESLARKDYYRIDQRVSYYLDVLCLGSLEDRQEFFLKDRKEVEKIGREINHLRAELAGN